MVNKKDKLDIEKAKQLIKEQVKATKKLNLGLDADASSSSEKPWIKSKFDGFINDDDLPPLNYK
ncbi:hypothetical protein [Pedobacter alpinus]|uniref:Uncharacterized protein n=1 Tax=Pedobacter alpinus TaxID=1590643 RepID=A0ABW5TW84_9SPHI